MELGLEGQRLPELGIGCWVFDIGAQIVWNTAKSHKVDPRHPPTTELDALIDWILPRRLASFMNMSESRVIPSVPKWLTPPQLFENF